MPGAFDRIVRCSRGHLFETIWIPGASLKALKLGPWRFQRCPVGNHLTFVNLVNAATLTPSELAEARTHQDIRVP